MDKQPKIVSIIDDYKVVINIGESDGAKLNQRYLLYAQSTEEIIDPDTGESLGFLEIVKGTGTLVHVQDKLSTLESDSYETSTRKITRKSPFSGLIGDTVEEVETNKQRLAFEDPEVGDLAKRIN
ncbi:MAG: hypothetical protein Q4F03_09500 [Eubacteriales bacterium]|nr:hypothetical protein [Eubacteriales bacterium]